MENIIEAKYVKQNRQDFLIGTFSIKRIFKFTKYTERLIVGFKDNGEPRYNDSIQRSVEKSRVEKIADYLINDPDATFPTNIVLHIPKQIIEEYIKDEKNNVTLKIDEKVFREIQKEKGDVYITIIDGQHRIRGIEVAISRLKGYINDLIKTLKGSEHKELNEKLDYYKERLETLMNIELVVTFFVDKVLEYQAMIFSTINRTQKRVSPSLVYSLFGLDTDDTPQKTALQIVLQLNSHNKSPFYNRIKLYGGSYDKNSNPPLSQATMVKSIVSLISENNREAENDRFRKRKELSKRSESSKKFLPFRKYYAIDKDNIISDILFFFFNEVREVFSKQHDSLWNFDADNKPTNILHTTVGYEALLKILEDILKIETNMSNLNYENADDIFRQKYLSKISDLNLNDINRYSFNQRGKKYFYLDMSLAIWPPKSADDKRLEELRKLTEEN
ncbi:MAG: DGQHR domain-containing protein [Dokdonia sp.]|jgi:DGQHR domain-containing protein